ncbi:DUF1028 domain-containing protein [Candidatus Lucifugimonas marina]|jgi:uncharacterized Ntn-hydrolase superfamily protein|uniref:DUF1028 domain-containing protein n=1 Tax=Candidatus Lucifugimonas marina TaxID=3038979 RepID=A0AAJ5ZII3_9CHLR|nr:DUF1028 domain-containing protein [SAR202 cluster bacterium JH702]MDG0870739.1 DUF1028 domain-containing protein [SAR202 cluster bacterium JH639]WFG34823.1 DUF1028 domain-containing protein [SAR202 cluster bacterium JH545]WFG38763.1 DUF1028 domain-containing protein [SAR202 cluster bacterium JH1073]
MTFTILGRNPANGELGIGIATYSLAVGATCPKILPGIGVSTSQASTNPAIGEELMELIEDGSTPVEAFMEALANDEHLEFRQIALLPANGEPLIHSGKNIKPVSGHLNGDNCVAVGNFLANEQVLPAIVEGFSNTSKNATLAERIIYALEAGKNAGGQSGANGAHLPERSAALLIGAPGERFPIDIRVDASTDAIPELRTTYNTYLPMHEFYLKRADDPTNLPSQDDWVNGTR